MRYLLVIVIGLSLVACGGSGSSGSDEPAAVVVNEVSASTDSNTLTVEPGSLGSDGSGTVQSWTVEPGSASPVVLMEADPGTGAPTFTFPLNGSYRLRLVIADGSGGLSTTILSVDVQDPNPFTIDGEVNDDGAAVSGLACQLYFVPASESTAAASSATTAGAFSFQGLIGAQDQFSVLVPGS